MQFAAIPGLPETKEKLLNAVKVNHLAHALLFHGPEGSANLTLALALASYLYCEAKTDTDSCGICGSCQRMNKLILPDLSLPFQWSHQARRKREGRKRNQMYLEIGESLS